MTQFRVMKRWIWALFLCLGLLACTKNPAAAPPHEYTDVELAKFQLDSLVYHILDASGAPSLDRLPAYLRSHGKLTFRLDGTLHYILSGTGTQPVVELQIRPDLGKFRVDAAFPGEMELTGYVQPEAAGDKLLKQITNLLPSDLSSPMEIELSLKDTRTKERVEAMDAACNLTLYHQGRAMADFGFEPIHENQAGEDEWLADPVFRFSDGTSYSLSSILLVEPLMDLYLNEGYDR